MRHKKDWLKTGRIPYWMYRWFYDLSAEGDKSRKPRISEKDWSLVSSCWMHLQYPPAGLGKPRLSSYQINIIDKIYSRYQRVDVRNRNW